MKKHHPGHQGGQHFLPKQHLEKEVARGRVTRRRKLVPGWSSFEVMRLQAASCLSREIIGLTVWQSLGPGRTEKTPNQEIHTFYSTMVKETSKMNCVWFWAFWCTPWLNKKCGSGACGTLVMLTLCVFPGPLGGRPRCQKEAARGRVSRRRKLVPG